MITLGVACHHNDQRDAWTTGCAVFDRQILLATSHVHTDTPLATVASSPGLQQCLSDAGIRPGQLDALVIADPAWPLPGTTRPWQSALQHPALVWRRWRHQKEQENEQADTLTALRTAGFDSQRLQLTRVNSALARAIGCWQWCCGSHAARVLSLIDADEALTTGIVIDVESADSVLLEQKVWPIAPLTALRLMADFVGIDLDRQTDTWRDVCAAGQVHHYQLERLFSAPDGLLNQLYLKPDHWQAFRQQGRTYGFSQQLVDWLGEPTTASKSPPYTHYAAAVQHMVGEALLQQLQNALALSDHQQTLVLAGHHLDCLSSREHAFRHRLAEGFAELQCFIDPFPARAGDALHAALYHQWRHGFREFTAQDSSILAAFGTHTRASGY